MHTTPYNQALCFIGGGIFISGWVVALLFARFYRRTRDRLFLVFAVAFAILACTSATALFTTNENIGSPYLYGIRFLAFLCIVIAILDKNRKSQSL